MAMMAGTWAFASDSNKTIITIGNADNTSYRKNKKDDTDEIVLNGNVTISVEKGETKLEIAADKVTYNRSTEMLFAEGGIAGSIFIALIIPSVHLSPIIFAIVRLFISI